MTTTGGIHHFAIKVRDLAAAERFYQGVLGLTVLRRWPSTMGEGDRSIWMDLGDDAGTFLALESLAPAHAHAPAPAHARAHEETRASSNENQECNGGSTWGGDSEPDADHPGHHLLALRIARDQRAIWEAKLAAARVAVVRRTAHTIYFTDPEGNRLGLSHFPDPAEQP